MKRPLHNSKGTTLVELIVSILLLMIFTLAAVTLIRPCAEAFMLVQKQTRAQNLADALVENLRLELQNAGGTLRFAEAGSTETDKGKVFASLATEENPRPAQGSALEFERDGYVEIVDAGYAPPLQKAGTTVFDGTPGYLHMRYWSQSGGNPQSNTPYDCTDAYAKGAYMGMQISTLQFSARGWQYDANGSPKLTSLTVLLAISDSDGTVLCTQKAILPLPGQPVYTSTPLVTN